MSAVLLPESETPDLTAANLHRVSVEQYQAFIASGALTDDDQIELLDGYLVNKMPRNAAHDMAILLLLEALQAAVPGGWCVRGQCGVRLAASQPEPDAAIVRGRLRDYTSQPRAGDIGLVVEVADSSLRRDRRLKAAIYAEAGLPVYWIVNLTDRVVEVYTRPNAAERRYEDRADIPVGETIPLVLDGAEVARLSVAEFMP